MKTSDGPCTKPSLAGLARRKCRRRGRKQSRAIYYDRSAVPGSFFAVVNWFVSLRCASLSCAFRAPKERIRKYVRILSPLSLVGDVRGHEPLGTLGMGRRWWQYNRVRVHLWNRVVKRLLTPWNFTAGQKRMAFPLIVVGREEKKNPRYTERNAAQHDGVFFKRTIAVLRLRGIYDDRKRHGR